MTRPQTPAELFLRQAAGHTNADERFTPGEGRRLGIEDYPHLWQPWNSRPSNQMFSIATPTTSGVDVLLGQFKVPVNWTLSINELALVWSGAGFPEGSGQLVWRIKINGNPPNDWGNTTFQVGTTFTPCPIPAILARSNSLIQIFVNNSALAGWPGTNVFAILRGWEWPAPYSKGKY